MERNEAEIKFLHPSGPASSFTYPAKDDILMVKREDILTKVNPTTATGRTYQLQQRDIDHATEQLTKT